MNLLSNLSFKAKILGTVALSCIICGAIAIGVAVFYNNMEFHSGLIEKSRIIHGRLDVAARYVAEQGGLDPMIEKFTSMYSDSSQLTKEDKEVILRQVPIYAAMKIGADGSEKDHYNFRVFSNEPRNEKNAATPEEMKIFNQFEKDKNLEELVSDQNGFVTVYRPIRLTESHGCFTCHGAPSTSPWKNGRDILGYKMEDWKEGKLHGVFAISNDINAILKAQAEEGGPSSTMMLALFIFLGGLMAMFIASLIVKGPIAILTRLSNTLSRSGVDVNDASTNIASSSEALSQASTEQASSLEETAASLEEISSMIEKALESADMTASSSLNSQSKAEEGRTSVNEMLSSMNEISQSNADIMTQVNSSNQKMAEIVHVINEIGNKTKVINEIVFQTKLLSFNASVEAARAGEHGKGFAVVAEEVGNLAEMSGNAAKEITTMLESSISKVEQIAESTKSSVEVLINQGKQKVDSGVHVAKQCSEVLGEIVENVSQVSRLSQEISQACKEQALGVREINKAMGQLDTVTQNNTSTSHATASSADQLAQQAMDLNSAVEELVGLVNGTQATNTSTRGKQKRAKPLKPSKKESQPAAENNVIFEDFPIDRDDPRFSDQKAG